MELNPTSLFTGTACYYSRYRLGYPEGLLGILRTCYRPDGAGRLLDLGCGTGQLAIPLRRDFAEVVGIDISPEMIAEAARICREQRIPPIDFRVMPAEHIDKLPDQFDLIVCGNALHWMERSAVLTKSHALLTEGGGMAIFAGGSGSVWSGVEPWQQETVRVIKRWLGDTRLAGDGEYPQQLKRHEDFIAASPFTLRQTGDYSFGHRWDIAGIIGNLYSTSYCNKRLLGDRAAAFEADLRRTLLALNPTGQFSERLEITYFFLRK